MFLDRLGQDARYALHVMRRAPAFTAAATLSLALGIGANAAIFGVINGLLLRPLPIVDPYRLATISSDSAIARGNTLGRGWSVAMWQQLQPYAHHFDGVLAWTPARFDLALSGERQLGEGLFAR